MIDVDKITEIYPGHYHTILNFPNASDLPKIIDNSYKFIWGLEHNEGRSSWSKYQHTLFGKEIESESVQSRNICMEYLVSTNHFMELIPHINQTIKLLLINQEPPSYLKSDQLSGKTWYDMLKTKVDYLFEIEIPGASDYSPIISPKKNFLEEVIQKLSGLD